MHRSIKVTGKGKITVKPDTVRLIITQSKVEERYERAVAESTYQKESLTRALEELGFEAEELKTQYFHVNAETEGYQDKSGCWKNRTIGYRFTHRMKLEFPRDDEKLGAVLSVLTDIPGNPEFDLEYTVADPEAAKNELLESAFEDSKQKASLLAMASNSLLGDVRFIDYSWGEVDLVTRPVNQMLLRGAEATMACKSTMDMDIEPEDIELTDTVTVLWDLVL